MAEARFRATDAIERVELGDDVLFAQHVGVLLAEQQISHEIVLSSDPYVGLQTSTPHLLLVRAVDRDAALEIVLDAYGDDLERVGGRSAVPRRWRLVGGVLLFVSFAGPMLYGIVSLVERLL